MVEFFVYDITFLAIFILVIGFLLYKNKKNLKREGLMYLYRARWGMEAIDYIGDKYKKTLHFVKYISITTGFVLMGTMIYLLWKNLYIYLSVPNITSIIKAPPIAPLIPYFPKLYGLESFFPPFYFTYFIIALGIIAITHEFSHGIYMRLFKIKIKSTGFAFFGPFLGAFVEEDRKSFTKKSNLGQMSVLSAGAFANIITAITFFLVLILFFNICFSPSGYVFNTYSYSIIPLNETSIVNEIIIQNMTTLSYNNNNYYLDELLIKQIPANQSYIVAYDSSPALKTGLRGIIIKMNNVSIKNHQDMQVFMQKTSPGQIVEIKTLFNEDILSYNLTLDKNPLNKSLGYLGVSFLQSKPSGTFSKIISLLDFKEKSTYYKPKFDGNLVYFVYYLFWWIALISALVGLFNMLPLGILDGGRFFYLAVFSLTKSKKFSEKLFNFVSWLIFMVFTFITLIWLFQIIGIIFSLFYFSVIFWVFVILFGFIKIVMKKEKKIL